MASSKSLQPPRSAVADRLLDTKLVPPKAPRRIAGRERLIAQLLEARRKRCVVLQGQGGCGKTTLLIAWRQALLPLGFDVAWLSLSERDDDLTRLLDCLLASLAQIDPAMTREASLLTDPGADADSAERAIVALVRGISAHPREVVLMLDDLHHLGSRAALSALQWMLDFSPPNLHLVLASRGTPPLSLARLRAQGLVLELDMREMRFTPEESLAFLQAHAAGIGERDAQLLHELTDGWAAGLQLLSVDWKKRQERGGRGAAAPLELARAQLQDARGFADYFEHEVIAQLAPTELELLVGASICNRFGPALCAALTGRTGADAEAASLLQRLVADDLFVAQVQSKQGESWYRLHPLLRETLRLRFDQRSEDERRALHLAAFRWFDAHGYLDEAVEHALLAGETETAAARVEQAAQPLSARGELRRLFGLLRQLPQAQIESHVDLQLWSLRLLMAAREMQACAQIIECLLARSGELLPRQRHILTLMRATLAVQRDDSEAATALLPQLLAIPDTVEAFSLGGRVNLLSWIYLQLGEYERARQVQANTPPLLVDGVPLLGTASGSLQGRCLVGLSHALEGHIAQAERVYGEVLHESESRGRAFVEPACMAAALLGEAFYERGDMAGVLRLLEARVEVLERLSIPDSMLRVMTVLASAHWLEGRRLESFAYLERLEDHAQQLGLDRLLAHSLHAQIQRRLELQDFEAADALRGRMEALHRKHPRAERGASGEVALMAQRAQVLWDLAHGDLEHAATRLAPLVNLAVTRGDQRLTAQLRLQMAIVEHRCGRAPRARAQLEEALRLGHRLGLMRSLLDVDPFALELMRLACAEPDFDPVLRFFAERLEGAARPAEPAPERAVAPGTRAGGASAA
ncbi:AAA family ATPase, partial [Variovorax soli]